MKPLQFIISNYGAGITIGMIGDKQLAQECAILAENIFGWYHSDELFDGMIHAPGVEEFRKFLIIKEYFLVWDEHWGKNRVAGRRDPAKVLAFTKRAIKRANLIMETVKFENYMSQISNRNAEYALGSHNDEQGEE